mmetsp:Transcript_12143/g.48842  ORF Transcript_12143/g.48842 Transcript_12143/m.48842 type:complete len:254 (-) Transcript_12143:1191-1952(-)
MNLSCVQALYQRDACCRLMGSLDARSRGHAANVPARVCGVDGVGLNHVHKVHHVLPVATLHFPDITLVRVLYVFLILLLNNLACSRLVVVPAAVLVLPDVLHVSVMLDQAARRGVVVADPVVEAKQPHRTVGGVPLGVLVAGQEAGGRCVHHNSACRCSHAEGVREVLAKHSRALVAVLGHELEVSVDTSAGGELAAACCQAGDTRHQLMAGDSCVATTLNSAVELKPEEVVGQSGGFRSLGEASCEDGDAPA